MNNNDYLAPAPIVTPTPSADTVTAADGYSVQEQPRHARGENPAFTPIDELGYFAQDTGIAVPDALKAPLPEVSIDEAVAELETVIGIVEGEAAPTEGAESPALDHAAEVERDMAYFTARAKALGIDLAEAGGIDAAGSAKEVEASSPFEGALPTISMDSATIDQMNRQQYGEDLSPAQLAFLRGEGNELSSEETADLERRLALNPPQFRLDSLPSDEEADLPPLTEVERADLMGDLAKINAGRATMAEMAALQRKIQAGQATPADMARLQTILASMPRMRSLLADLKRMQKQFPLVHGRHVRVKQRTSKTRKKKR